jgi:hypothetical protein
VNRGGRIRPPGYRDCIEQNPHALFDESFDDLALGRGCRREQANKGAARARVSAFLPAFQAGSSVIVAKITYAFTPLLGLNQVFSPGAFDMKRTHYARPRKSLTVQKTDAGC